MFIGFVVMSLGVLGLVSIVRGNPSVFAPVRDVGGARGPDVAGFADAGGFIGTIGAYPLSRVVAGRRVPRRPRPRHDRDADHDRHLVRRARPRVSSARAAIGERVQARKAAAQDKARAKLEKQRIKDEGAAAKAEAAQDAGKGPRAPWAPRRPSASSPSGWGSPSPSSCCRSRSPSARSIRLVRRRGRRRGPYEAPGPHDRDGRRPLPAPPARPSPRRTAVDERRRAREGHHGGARPYALDVRSGCA